MPLPPNIRLGRYEIRSQLGAGGMGEVYLAQDTELERTVALKVLPEMVASDKQRMQRFIREAKTASSLNHPNILTIFEIGHDDQIHFIATEFIEGETLRQHIQSTRMKVSDAVAFAIQTADALAAAHEAGIIHRDVKPENIMLRRRDSYVKILDFGLAKLTERPPASADSQAPTQALFRTEDGVVVGTTLYMSPEQARGIGVDARTDIWSLGVVLYEMITGCLPFEGKTTSEVLASILSEKEPPPLARFARDVPAELERIVEKTLCKDREERYQTAKDLLLDLKRLKQRLEFKAELERSAAPHRDAVRRTDEQTLSETSTRVAARGAPTTALHAQSPGTTQELNRPKRLRVLLLLAALIVVIIAIAGYFYFSRENNTIIQSITVMPFVNASGNPDVEYLSDGMTETLISNLSQLPNLNVKARSSVFRYKGKETDAKTIGRELNVQAILNGRVVQRGDQLTLSLELIDAQTENVIWSEQYNRKQADLVSLQNEIARDVSNKLRVKLSGADEQKLTKKYTENTEAYKLYLQGRFYWNKRTPQDIRTSAAYFQQAITVDPNYALAYVGISDSYLLLGIPDAMTDMLSPQESLPQARAAADRALEIDGSLAEAYASRAHVRWKERDWTGAEEDFKRSIGLNPNYANARLFYGLYLSSASRHEEALRELRQAQEIDPLSFPINAGVGFALYFARRYDEAIEQYKKTLEMDSTFALVRQRLGLAYAQKGAHREAVAELQQAMNYSNRAPLAVASLGYVYAVSGNKGEAQKMLSELKDLSERRYISTYSVAMIYVGLGEKEQALQWLARGYEERNIELAWIKVEPRLDPLRDDPRFQELLRKIGSPQ
ncbi:MAG TPA: protein kinase [Pyrinomonadaceae bacterium]